MPFRVLFLALLILSPHTLADGATLDECQSWYKQVDKYQDLRRRGGSGPEMESWKKQRRIYEDKIREGDCEQYGRKARQYPD